MNMYSGGLNIQWSQLGHRAQGLNLKGCSTYKKQKLPRIKWPQAKYPSQKKTTSEQRIWGKGKIYLSPNVGAFWLSGS